MLHLLILLAIGFGLWGWPTPRTAAQPAQTTLQLPTTPLPSRDDLSELPANLIAYSLNDNNGVVGSRNGQLRSSILVPGQQSALLPGCSAEGCTALPAPTPPTNLPPIPAGGATRTLVVDTNATTTDGTTTSVNALLANRGADGKLSLPEAIAAINNDATPDQSYLIRFALPADQRTIQLRTTLTLAASNVTLDGQFDGSPLPDVTILPPDLRTVGLRITGARNTVRAVATINLALEGFLARDNRIEQSHLGSDQTGNPADLHGTHGIQISHRASGTVIVNNLINQNRGTALGSNGILIRTGASNTVVRNNLVGGWDVGLAIADASTSTTLVVGNTFGGNGSPGTPRPNQAGVGLFAGTSQNMIGTTSRPTVACSDGCNTLVANSVAGVLLLGVGTSQNTVAGNQIGLIGNQRRANLGDGIMLGEGASANLIGGLRSSETCNGACNLIRSEPRWRDYGGERSRSGSQPNQRQSHPGQPDRGWPQWRSPRQWRGGHHGARRGPRYPAWQHLAA